MLWMTTNSSAVSSDQVDRDVDIAAYGFRIRTYLVRLFRQSFGDFALNTRQADVEASLKEVLVPLPAVPGVESLMSRWPSELRDTPCSRPPVVWVLAVYSTFWVTDCRPMANSFSSWERRGVGLCATFSVQVA
jgi:hypothetical protein